LCIQLMFNLLCVRSAAIPRLQRLLADPNTPSEFKPTYRSQLETELEKVRRGKLENGLRRNNLVPLMVELTKILAEQKGQGRGKSVLEEVTEKARVTGREKRARRAERE
jgi:ubiquitin carboxyl-terminal hydrolase L5